MVANEIKFNFCIGADSVIRRDHYALTLAMSGEPIEQPRRIADSRGEADPLYFAPRDFRQSLQQG